MRTPTTTAGSASRSSCSPGTVKLYDGTGWISTASTLHCRGGLHGFRNESGEPASCSSSSPGRPRGAYFEGLVEMAEGRWKPSQEELQAFFEEHDNIYV